MDTTPANPAPEEAQAFRELGPDAILDAVESIGYRCDGRFIALNSYENRVYQVGIEDAAPLIAKFYRPGRWSDAAILEEFCAELAEHDLPVVAPLAAAGITLHRHGPYRFSLYPRRGGRAPELDDVEHLEQLGRLLGRIHNVGAVHPFAARPTLDVEHFGWESYRFLLGAGFIPAAIEHNYRLAVEALLQAVETAYAVADGVTAIRLHGDCHPGNILTVDGAFHIVDLDDARQGPAVQDLWMFLSGERDYRQARLMDLLIGYTEFRDFEPRELHLVEALRALRLLHFAAWLGRRWDDPAFPLAFPWFNTERYWDEHLAALREQLHAVEEPPLVWD